MSWEVRVIRNRYADSVRLMGVAQALREQRRRPRVRGGDGHAGQPRGARRARRRRRRRPDRPRDRGGRGAGPTARWTRPSASSRAPPAPTAAPAAASRRARWRRGAELDGANVALISVPGEYAVLEAHRALTAGMHVFLFSDHVSRRRRARAQAPRRRARPARHGPGVRHGDARRRRPRLRERRAPGPGRDRRRRGHRRAGGRLPARRAPGVGVSQIVGVGGRDLSADVGGIMFARGDADARRRRRHRDPAARLEAAGAARSSQQLGEVDVGGKRVVAAFVGWDGGEAPFEIHPTLEAGAFAAAGAEPPGAAELEARSTPPRAPARCSGSTPAARSRTRRSTILEPELGPLGGNAGDGGDGRATRSSTSARRSTRRAARTRWSTSTSGSGCSRRGRDDGVGCVLLDVVLGHGAHPDPAGGLAPALARAAPTRRVIAHVCGTAGRPAGRAPPGGDAARGGRRSSRPSNAAAARLARGRCGARREDRDAHLLA